MAGWLYFGGDNGVSLGSTAIDVIAQFLRPYITQVSDSVVRRVYRTYDLYDQTLNFSKLTPEKYMQCYQQMKKAFEKELTSSPIFSDKPQQWAIDVWFDEIKPEMKRSPLFDAKLVEDDEA